MVPEAWFPLWAERAMSSALRACSVAWVVPQPPEPLLLPVRCSRALFTSPPWSLASSRAVTTMAVVSTFMDWP